jgi:hypothetical protein
MSLTPISTMSTPSTAAISLALFTASADSNCTITMVASLIAALASGIGNERYCKWGRTPAAPRALRRLDDGARFFGRADVWRNDAERAAVEHARNIFGRIAGHANHGSDPGA